MKRPTANARSNRRKPPAEPEVTIELNEDVDWTPASQRVYPRRVIARRGKQIVCIEEAGRSDAEMLFYIGAGDGTESVLFNLMSGEMRPAELDTLIDALALVRDRARSLGMPSDKRPSPCPLVPSLRPPATLPGDDDGDGDNDTRRL